MVATLEGETHRSRFGSKKELPTCLPTEDDLLIYLLIYKAICLGKVYGKEACLHLNIYLLLLFLSVVRHMNSNNN